LLSALAESFTTLPISATPLNGAGFRQLRWGVKVFSSGLQLSLPSSRPAADEYRAGHPDPRRAVAEPVRHRLPDHAHRRLHRHRRHLPYLTGPLDNLFMQGIESQAVRWRAAGRRKSAAGAAGIAQAQAAALNRPAVLLYVIEQRQAGNLRERFLRPPAASSAAG